MKQPETPMNEMRKAERVIEKSGLPASIEAEKTILGAILLDNAVYAEASAILKAEDFALDSHRELFTVMGDMVEMKIQVDHVTLVEAMMKMESLVRVGGAAYIAYLTEGLPRRLSMKDYIRIVKEKAVRRQIINACSAAITKAADASLTPAEIVEQLGKDLKGVRKGK